MRKVPLRKVKEGDILALDLYTEDFKLLLVRGTKLSFPLITLMSNRAIKEVFIEDEHTDDVTYSPLLFHDARKEIHKDIYRVLFQYLSQKEIGFKFNSVDLGKEFEKISRTLLNYIATQPNILHSMHDLHVYDHYVLQHSLNVGMISGMIGMEKGLSKNELIELMVGAMLFDIGMTRLPKHVLNKKGTFSPIEKKVVQRHTMLGYEVLAKERNISEESALCALYHHERLDGAGYPTNLPGDAIHLYPRIVAVADVFDALTTQRHHRDRYSPHEAVEYLYASGGTMFDVDVIKSFLRTFAVFPVGSTVKLNNGLNAVVTEVFPDFPLRPMVRILEDTYGERLHTPIDVDLRHHHNVTIQ